jgi:hypothetical protein
MPKKRVPPPKPVPVVCQQCGTPAELHAAIDHPFVSDALPPMTEPPAERPTSPDHPTAPPSTSDDALRQEQIAARVTELAKMPPPPASRLSPEQMKAERDLSAAKAGRIMRPAHTAPSTFGAAVAPSSPQHQPTPPPPPAHAHPPTPGLPPPPVPHSGVVSMPMPATGETKWLPQAPPLPKP